MSRTKALPKHLEEEPLPPPAACSGWRTGSPLAAPYLQPVLVPVHNNGGDLLVHEDQDGAEQSWDERSQHCPPGVGSYGIDDPPAVVSGRLQRSSISSQPSPFAAFRLCPPPLCRRISQPWLPVALCHGLQQRPRPPCRHLLCSYSAVALLTSRGKQCTWGWKRRWSQHQCLLQPLPHPAQRPLGYPQGLKPAPGQNSPVP